VGVPTNILIDRTDVQTGATAQAVQSLTIRTAQYRRSAVVHNHHVQLFRSIQVVGATRTSEHGDVTGDFLPGGAVRQHLEHDGQIGQAWNDLFHTHHSHVHAWHGRG